MGTHFADILRGYNPYVEGLKPSFVHGFGVQGYGIFTFLYHTNQLYKCRYGERIDG